MLPQNDQARVVLFKNHVVSGAASEPVRRDQFEYHSIFVGYDGAAPAETAQVEIQVCGRDPASEADWVTLAAAANVPFQYNFPRGVFYAVRVKRNATTRPLFAVITSGGSSR